MVITDFWAAVSFIVGYIAFVALCVAVTWRMLQRNQLPTQPLQITTVAAEAKTHQALAEQSQRFDLALQKQAEAHAAHTQQVLQENIRTVAAISRRLGVSLCDAADAVSEAGASVDNGTQLRTKAERYINRLQQLNAERRAAFTARPILTAVANKISAEEQFSQSREEFLIRERALCQQVAVDRGLDIQLTTTAASCQLIRVIDGDTIDVDVAGLRYRVRLMGYDTPEVCHPSKVGYEHWGIQASEAAERILSAARELTIRLDKEGHAQSWCSDRYGRVLAHVEVDGQLLGFRMLEQGDAEVVDSFPIEAQILSLYKKTEHGARVSDLGMWADINRYKLQRKAVKGQQRYSLQTLMANRVDRNLTTELLRDVLRDMLGSLVVKTKRSVVVHRETCRHVARMGDPLSVAVDEDWLQQNKDLVRPCKICQGDELVRELASS